jgi:hypothetical protein
MVFSFVCPCHIGAMRRVYLIDTVERGNVTE